MSPALPFGLCALVLAPLCSNPLGYQLSAISPHTACTSLAGKSCPVPQLASVPRQTLLEDVAPLLFPVPDLCMVPQAPSPPHTACTHGIHMHIHMCTHTHTCTDILTPSCLSCGGGSYPASVFVPQKGEWVLPVDPSALKLCQSPFRLVACVGTIQRADAD